MDKRKSFLKGMLMLFGLCLVLCLSSIRAEAASNMKKLSAGKTYSVKLTGSKKHKVKYTRKKSNGAYSNIKLYVDGRKVKTITQYALGWEVYLCTVAKNRNLLYIRDISDNDWNGNLYIYEYKNKKMIQLADLAAMTRDTYPATGKFLRGWSRGKLVKVSANKLVIRWLCTGTSNGMYYIDIPYKVSGAKISRSGTSYTLKFPNKYVSKTWTSKRRFNTYTNAGGRTLSFAVYAGQKVTALRMTKKNGSTYFQIKNSAGKKGWFVDPTVMTSKNVYFEEAQFAG